MKNDDLFGIPRWLQIVFGIIFGLAAIGMCLQKTTIDGVPIMEKYFGIVDRGEP